MRKQTITNTQAVYNRNRQIWQVIAPTGEITSEFPRGQQGKYAATLEAIRQDDPQGYQAAADFRFNRCNPYPETWSRIWKAARLVADETIYTAHPLSQHNQREAYHVKSQSGDFFYTVTRKAEFYDCTCPDFDEFHAPTIRGQKLCKHIFAVKIMKAIPREIPAYLDSPRRLFRWLEETAVAYTVIGAWNRRPYLYAQPQQRPAVAGEIIQDNDGQTWRLTHNGQRFNSWRFGLPAQMQPATAVAPAAQVNEEETMMNKARQYGNARRINHKERGLRERSRLEGDRALAQAYRQRQAAEAANADLFG